MAYVTKHLFDELENKARTSGLVPLSTATYLMTRHMYSRLSCANKTKEEMGHRDDVDSVYMRLSAQADLYVVDHNRNRVDPVASQGDLASILSSEWFSLFAYNLNDFAPENQSCLSG